MHLGRSRIGKWSEKRWSRKLLEPLIQLLNRRTILLLTVLFVVGVTAAFWNMSRLSMNLIRSQALQNSALYAQSIRTARTLYSDNAVHRVENVLGVQITPDYAKIPNAIPIPATYLIELGQLLSQKNPGMSVRLYSDYPFRWRKTQRGPQDDFERQALIALRQQPDKPFVRFENFQGRLSVRYAEADRMQLSCVGCHNTHPDTPKRDWRVGDVRGVLAISTPLDQWIATTNAGLRSTFMMLAGLLTLALIGIALVVTRLRHTSQELELRVLERTAELQAVNRELSIEQAKSERLLLNILPEPIAQQLKEGQSNIANGFAEATILFADLVNFTQLAEAIAPTELVALLNEIFSEFDHLTEKHGLEKIKTIGDAYMVVGGLPMPRPDHAVAIAEMALDMQQAIAQFNQRHHHQCDLRIGINTGPVIAGVIGTKKFIYDLWGDTVNVASRMESHGLAGAIQVTTATYEHLKSQYIFQPRGPLFIKGKGEMLTYLLIERVPATTFGKIR